MAEDLQYWIHNGNVWGNDAPMSQPCHVAALPVIGDFGNRRVDEQSTYGMNSYNSSSDGVLVVDQGSCFNSAGFDLLPLAHDNWPDQDLFQFSGRTSDRSHLVMIQEEEEVVNPKRYKFNQETTSAWSPNNFCGSINPCKESTIDDDLGEDRRPWNSPKTEPTCGGVLCNNTLGPSAAFWGSIQSLDDHSNFITSIDVSHAQIGLLHSFVEKRNHKKGCNGDSLRIVDDEYLLRRVRMETPSPLPTFKLRKEKLGDRVTALQQLVSPFGKTDTASVLHEAVQYIEFLHNQVQVLSCPYMKKGPILSHQQAHNRSEDGLRHDLRSRGLCLVPISSTLPVADHELVSNSAWTATLSETSS